MLPQTPIGRVLVLTGVTLMLVGFLWPALSRLPLGRLPGDVAIQRDGWSFSFPIVTCLVLSVVATVVLNWLRR